MDFTVHHNQMAVVHSVIINMFTICIAIHSNAAIDITCCICRAALQCN